MVLEKIREIISARLGIEPSEINPDIEIRKDLNADSLELFQIVNDIEDEFDVKIEDAEIINTVEDAIKVIKEQTKDRN